VTATPTTPPTPTTTPTPTPTVTSTEPPIPSPRTTCADPQQLGGLQSGQSESYGGLEEGTSASWFTIIFSAGTSLTITVAPSSVQDSAGQTVPAGSDVFSVADDCTGVFQETDLTTFTATTPGAYLIEVFEGPNGSDGGYLLTASDN